MRTKDLEEQLGLTKHTIHFYEKEGFIQPERDENGYRNYSMEDVQTLEMLKFLRGLMISLEDCKGILEGSVSFQEVLRVNEVHLENQIASMEEIKESVSTYQAKNIPLIPSMLEVKECDKLNGILGFKKSTPTVSLGQVLTKKLAIKKLLVALGLEILVCGFTFHLLHEIHVSIVVSAIVAAILFILLGIFMLGSGFTAFDLSIGQSVEFLEEGLRYYKNTGLLNILQYYIAVMKGKEKELMVKRSYEEIAKVKIDVQKRFMRISSYAIPLELYVPDYQFYLKGGEVLSIIGAMTLDDDSRYIAHILENKVANIEDEKNLLYALKNGIALNDYLIESK